MENFKSLFEEQKKNKPKIEDVVSSLLDSDIRQNALEFIAYLRENKLSPLWTTVNSWKVNYKGKVLCYIKIDKNEKYFWYIHCMPSFTKKFEDFIIKENLLDVLWENVAVCKRCHPKSCASELNENKDTFTGVKKTILGKEFDDMCRGGDYNGAVGIVNPNQKTIAFIKKILEFNRKIIEENKALK